MIRAVVATGALVAGLLASPVGARAEGCGEEEAAAGEPKKVKWHWEVIDGKRVQVLDEAARFCGKVPRPNVVLLLKVKNINYEWENLKQDFLPLILAAVKKAPF